MNNDSLYALLRQQHVDCITSIDRCLHAAGTEGTRAALEFFRASWVRHTKTEEQFMCDIQYEARGPHIGDHEAILSAIDGAIAELGTICVINNASENPICKIYDRLMLHLQTFDSALDNKSHKHLYT